MLQLKLHRVTLQALAPQEQILWKLEAAPYLSFVRKETAHLYSRNHGRLPINPEILVKYQLEP